MRQQWLILGIVAVLISGCTTKNEKGATSVLPIPTRDVLGAEPVYEPYHPSANQDYTKDGVNYHIVKDPAQFTQTGYASVFGEESTGKLTAIGERDTPYALTAAHPTLSIPGYVRVTNLSNGRMIIVRVNDRGPYNKSGKIIELSRAVADRLNLMPQSKVKLDGIQVAPDGSLAGLGTEGSTIIKQSYALPGRPALNPSSSASATGMASGLSEQTHSEQNPSANANTVNTDSQSTSQPEKPASVQETVQETPAQTKSVVTSSATPESADVSGYMVQVGAVSTEAKAREWQQSLSKRFDTPGRVIQFGHVYRVQLGPFNARQQAVELQKKLTAQMQQSSFITTP
ncbi:endolytic peptidoglycan transglycosylase RlpA [Xenorhabdus sp. PB30.3]|uniref:endolytic peptidoglycan transglycosylase RlpA n=1 Tax=Xenorhabdus sp. PB30.3 TaxID=2788941 RepID=UPI001E421726|nr:endolytic peptidoglycan transglycosylase RlpA [Xenorhabdus sp. PB30.3]MCC8378209.1 endolytic peptidoglycan transglycosylase RlpA [Xenorhabdus sp. PB30.3]